MRTKKACPFPYKRKLKGRTAGNILIVDCDRAMGRFAARILNRAGYAVCVVARGTVAIRIAEKAFLDLMIFDPSLGDMDGLELMKTVRESSNCDVARLPIIIFSGMDSPQDKVTGLSAGADDYVTKPFDPEVLVARVRALLRRRMLV